MPYLSDGSLTTDSREVAIDTTWDTQTDWEAYQSINNVEITNGVLSLAETLVVDDYEDNDIAEYSGDTGEYTTVTSPVSEGTYALSSSLPSGSGGNYSISSTSGLPSYPSRGDTHSIDIQLESLNDSVIAVAYFAQSAGSLPDGYYAVHNIGLGEFRIRKRSGGSNTTLQSTNVDYTGIDTAFWTLEMSTAAGGGITHTLYDDTGSQVGQVSTTDSDYTSGGVGYQLFSGSTSQTMYLDNWVIL